MSSAKAIVLRSSDGKTFVVDEALAFQSQMIKDMIESSGYTAIPLINVTSDVLSKIIDYCKMLVESRKNGKDLKSFYSEFVNVNKGVLLDLVMAANYLNIKSLIDLTYQAMVDITKGKIPYEMRLMSNAKTIVLRSSDGKTFEVDEACAFQSEMIKDVIMSCGYGDITLHNVTSNVLSKIIDYCIMHVESPNHDDEEDLKSFDSEFVKVDRSTLFALISAANYLNFKSLLDLTCQAMADMIKGRTPDEIRTFFNIREEFTPEEEEEIRRENAWAFE